MAFLGKLWFGLFIAGFISLCVGTIFVMMHRNLFAVPFLRVGCVFIGLSFALPLLGMVYLGEARLARVLPAVLLGAGLAIEAFFVKPKVDS